MRSIVVLVAPHSDHITSSGLDFFNFSPKPSDKLDAVLNATGLYLLTSESRAIVKGDEILDFPTLSHIVRTQRTQIDQ